MKFRIIKFPKNLYMPQFFDEYSNQWIDISNDNTKFYTSPEEAEKRCDQFMENDEINNYRYVYKQFER